MKICRACQALLPAASYQAVPNGRLGLHSWCRSCVSEYNKVRYVRSIKPRLDASAPPKILPYTPLEKNKTALSRATPGFTNARATWYQLHKRKRLPKWLAIDDVLPLYALADKFGLTVDHIVPLNGKTVSGLHVPWNLQLLTRSENSRKGASFV